MKEIYQIVNSEPMQKFTNEKGETSCRRKIVLRELGGKFADTFLGTAFGAYAEIEFSPQDVVAARLSFRVNEYEDKKYQDILVNEIVKLKRA